MTSSAIAPSPEGAGEGLIQTLADRGAVGEPGQGIATRLFGDARLEQRRAQRQRVSRRRNEQRQDRSDGDAQRAPAHEARIAVEIGRRRDDGERRIGDRRDITRPVAAERRRLARIGAAQGFAERQILAHEAAERSGAGENAAGPFDQRDAAAARVALGGFGDQRSGVDDGDEDAENAAVAVGQAARQNDAPRRSDYGSAGADRRPSRRRTSAVRSRTLRRPRRAQRRRTRRRQRKRRARQ